MNKELRHIGITKLAFFGPAGVPGSPHFNTPPCTVGQVMYGINAYQGINNLQRRKALDDIVSTNMNVNSPAKRLLHAGIGAVTGNLVSKMMGASPFMQGMATAIGANYGLR